MAARSRTPDGARQIRRNLLVARRERLTGFHHTGDLTLTSMVRVRTRTGPDLHADLEPTACAFRRIPGDLCLGAAALDLPAG